MASPPPLRKPSRSFTADSRSPPTDARSLLGRSRKPNLTIDPPPQFAGYPSRSPVLSPGFNPYSTSKQLAFDGLELRCTDAEAKKSFIRVLLKGASADPSPIGRYDDSFNWFCAFLEARFNAVRDSHFRPCTQGSPEKVLYKESLDLCSMYNMMAALASAITNRQNHVTLTSLVEGLLHLKIFKSENDECKELMNQLVFMSIGWLSMLYNPATAPPSGRLQIANDALRPGRRRYASRIRRLDQDFSQSKQSFQTLLRVFGDIIPRVDRPEGNEQQALKEQEFLTVAYLSYHTLSKVCKLKIEWVDTLNLHLDFVESKQVLKVFRFPSFCQMMLSAQREECFLSNLFDTKSSNPTYDNEAELSHDQNVRDYFREVLLSYRLIFGQDSRSWKAWKHTWSKANNSRGRDSPSPGDSSVGDPLLTRLCGSNWKSEKAVYENLDAGEALNHYSPAIDFPILSHKLLRLQRFSKEQNPTALKLLWNDRRDIRLFYTFWAVLIIGGVNIVVSVCQVLLTAWQVRLDYENNWLTSEQNRLQLLQLEQTP